MVSKTLLDRGQSACIVSELEMTKKNALIAVRVLAAFAAAVLVFAWAYKASGRSFLGPVVGNALLPAALIAAVFLAIIGVVGYFFQVSGADFLSAASAYKIPKESIHKREIIGGGVLIGMSVLAFLVGSYINVLQNDLTNTAPGAIAALLLAGGVVLVIDGIKRKNQSGA